MAQQSSDAAAALAVATLADQRHAALLARITSQCRTDVAAAELFDPRTASPPSFYNYMGGKPSAVLPLPADRVQSSAQWCDLVRVEGPPLHLVDIATSSPNFLDGLHRTFVDGCYGVDAARFAWQSVPADDPNIYLRGQSRLGAAIPGRALDVVGPYTGNYMSPHAWDTAVLSTNMSRSDERRHFAYQFSEACASDVRYYIDPMTVNTGSGGGGGGGDDDGALPRGNWTTLINDARITVTDRTDYTMTPQERARCNACFVTVTLDNHWFKDSATQKRHKIRYCFVVLTRDVAAGEEILVDYDAQYWVGWWDRQSAEISPLQAVQHDVAGLRPGVDPACPVAVADATTDTSAREKLSTVNVRALPTPANQRVYARAHVY